MKTQFYHAGLDHYFITADAAEAQTLVDGTQPGWLATGQQFRALSATAITPIAATSTAVCRFYGSVTPGPNSHFYTLFPSECSGLKTLAQTTPASAPRWNYEGIAFAAGVPAADGKCPAPYPLAVSRFYNGRAIQNDSGHRYVTTDTAAQQMRAAGWIEEGVVMCALL